MNPVLIWSKFTVLGGVVAAKAKCAAASSGHTSIIPTHWGKFKN
jgi:hypothetical protein